MTDTLISTAGLGTVPETLLIPLAARAVARSRFPRTGFTDEAAEAIARRLDTDLARFSVDHGSMNASILRALWFDRVAERFLMAHPDGLCVSLGAGLDTRAQRIGVAGRPDATWLDLDLAEVIALRKALIPNGLNIRSAIGDATDPAVWIETASWPRGRPLLVLVEGVIMYLPSTAVRSLVERLCAVAKQRDAEMWLALDYASPLMVRLSRRHPSIKKTRAVFASSLRHPSDLMKANPELSLLDHQDVSSGAGMIGLLLGRLHRILTGGRRIHGCALYRYDSVDQ